MRRRDRKAADSRRSAHLDIARPPIEIQMTALDFSKVGKFVENILFCCFLMNISDQDDPSFDGYGVECTEVKGK